MTNIPYADVVARTRASVGDFRDAAVTASVDALAQRPGVDPLNAGISYCLPALEDKRSALTRFKIAMIIRLVVGLAGLIGGGLLAALMDGPLAGIDESLLLTIAACCSVGGILVLLSAAVGQGRFLRKHLGERYNAVVSIPSPFKPAAVGIEDAATFSKLKAAPEDLVIAVFDVEGRRIIMEGLSHSYLILARDVVTLQEVRGGASVGTRITYNCGGEELSIVLVQENIRHELKRQTIGTSKGPLHDQVHAALPPAETIDLSAEA